MSPDSDAAEQAFAADPLVFEAMHDALLFRAHNVLRFYTGSDERCCLPTHATRATLLDDVNPGRRLRLCPGDVLIFEEEYGPTTGARADADPAHRHAVRLTRVTPAATQNCR